MSAAPPLTPALPRPAPEAPAAAEPWFEHAPAGLLRLDDRGRVVAANAAARALLGSAAATAADPLAALGLAADGPRRGPRSLPSEPVPGPDGRGWLRVQAVPLPHGQTLLQVDDASEQVATRHALQRQREVLDLTQEFGRLGVWQRDVRTLTGSWDRHVYKFWGLDDHAGTPDFEAAARQIVDEDRIELDRVFRQSLRQAGTYGHRYRVRRQDGQLTHLHSQWAVKNGPDGRPDRVIGIMMDDTEAMRLARSHVQLQSQLALAGALAGLVVWRHDLRSGRVQLSDEGLALLRLAPDPDGVPIELIRARTHPDDVERARLATEATARGAGSSDVETRYPQPDGSCRHVLSRRSAQRDERGDVVAVIGVGLDITAREQARRRARELGDRFDLAVRAAGIGYWSREGGAAATHWSAQMRALHGLSPQAPVPSLRTWVRSFVHPDDRLAVRRQCRQWLDSGESRFQTELRIVRADGGVRHLMTHSLQAQSGPQSLLFGIAVDITERRLADLALRRADERAALAARGAGIGTWELDRRDGSIFWDAQMWRLRGRSPRAQAANVDELLGFVHPDDRPAMALSVARARDDDEVREHSFRVVWPDGTVRWLASRSATVRDAQGRPVRRIGVNWDVTAARQADADRNDRLAAEQANRAKSRFLARMSHELRTPLNAVIGFADLLQADDAPDRRADRVRHIRAAGGHLLSLIDDVLDLASLESGELRMAPQCVPLPALLAETLPLLESLQSRHALTVRQQVDDVAVHADPVRLRQVLLNLLSNACKYNRHGGTVDIRVRADAGCAVLTVEDSGRGMSAAQLRELYQPFNRLGIEREGIEGTGIGLTIVKALVERMGGTVCLHSEPGRGTRAVLRLPLADDDRCPVPAPAGVALRIAGIPLDPRRGLLYVEDNAVNTLIVRELMQRRPDIALQLAVDGTEGLALAAHDRPALVLLDMQLPDIDGLTVLARLRADPATADLPCIALSANAQPDDVAGALAAGMADYWTKPLDTAAFMGAIDALFGAPVGTRVGITA